MNTISVSNSLALNQNKVFGLIWIQIICKGYQLALAGKELNRDALIYEVKFRKQYIMLMGLT